MIEPAIRVRDLGKIYRVWRHPSDMLMEVVTGRKRHTEFQALEDISFDVPRGAIVGIMGRNGAGKSTLLRIVAGTLDATAGAAVVNGRIAAILELGTGFHLDYSGRENILLGGMCLGLSRKEMEALVDEIVEFAELRDFIDQPFRTYSSGMQARLTFAVATSVNADIIVIDEALSVGDARFQLKSFDRIRDFKRRGKSILLVSHDINAITSICDEAILLERGRMHARGVPGIVGNIYHELLFGAPGREATGPADASHAVTLSTSGVAEQQHRVLPTEALVDAPMTAGVVSTLTDVLDSHSGTTAGKPAQTELASRTAPEVATAVAIALDARLSSLGSAIAPGDAETHEAGANMHADNASMATSDREHRYGDGAVRIVSVEIQDLTGRPTTRLESLETYVIVCRVRAFRTVCDLCFGILVRDRRGTDIFGWDSRCGGIEATALEFKSPALEVGRDYKVQLQFRNNLAGGKYFLTTSLARENTEKLDLRLDVLEFDAEPTPSIFTASLVNLEVGLARDHIQANRPSLWDVAV